MKIVIEHKTTKREIEGAFNICGSRQDLSNLVSQLQEKLKDESWSYGWCVITTERQPSITNTPPKGWED